MTDQDLRRKYAEICNHLSARRLKPAFDMLGKLISENGLGIYYDEYKNLEETYQFMLKYTVEGIFDPERQKVYRKLIVSVFDMADKINEALRMKYSPTVIYDKKRSFRNSPLSDLSDYLTDLETSVLNQQEGNFSENEKQTSGITVDNQQKILRFFYHIWFSDKLSNEEAKVWSNFLTSSLLPLPYKSLIITAVMLSNQRYFDKEKLILLFDNIESENVEINQRALVGLLINLYKYDPRISFYPSITDRLKILNENAEFLANVERIIIQFIRSKDTEKLQKRIREEILPEMIKISPNLKNKINLESLMEEGLSEDKNPDWEDIFKDSPGLLSKMEEFSELQMKGDDVFMGSFSMLKSFPFFNEIANWFMPFYTENPEIADKVNADEQSVNQLMEAIKKAPILCNSDKYSFCLSIRNLPKENLEFMTQAMKAEMEQIKELRDDEELLDPGRKTEFISNQYIQDLYRFYKLFPRKADFEDVFSWRLDFHNKLGDIMKEDASRMRNIAEYYLIKEHFEEASGIFSQLLENEKSEELYQKIAWCFQKTGDYNLALEGYLKAELHGANNLWNIKKIALCYRNLKKPDKALEYYLAAENIDPDNLGNQLNIGHCLLELNNYDEALKCYFKVEYLAPGNKKVWRPIAWCSFLTGKKEQAGKYFTKLIDDEPNKHDFINMGHVQWSLGNRQSALDYYQKSISKEGFSQPEFLEVFEDDMPHLINQGIDKDDIPIMLDQLRYILGE